MSLKFTGLILYCLLTFLGCSSKTVPDPQYVPAGGLLDVLKDFQRLAREDQYRFPISKDVTGVNVMKATLLRWRITKEKIRGNFPTLWLSPRARLMRS